MNNDKEKNCTSMSINWYPGHMTKARRIMEEDIKLVDLIIELIDARLPLSSRNPDIDRIGNNKARIILINKSDMADKVQNNLWAEWFRAKGYFVVLINSKTGEGVRSINNTVALACKEKIERNKKKGIINRPMRAMVAGIPNIGKSTFINTYAGKAYTKTGNKPGVTKGKQWIRVSKTLELLDTPGILWPKFEDKNIGIRLAISGSINDDILNKQELSLELIKFLNDNYPDSLKLRYGIDEETSPVECLYKIAEKRGCLMKGGEPDTEKAAAVLLEDFRSCKLGRITLELCQDN